MTVAESVANAPQNGVWTLYGVDSVHKMTRHCTEQNKGAGERDQWHFYMEIDPDAGVSWRILRNAVYCEDIRIVDGNDPKKDPERLRARRAAALGIREEGIGIVYIK